MGNNVLVVEDDDELRAALSSTLRRAGIEAFAVDSAEAALDRLAAQPAALVVSDVQMGGMDGLALLRELRTRHADLPVLLMTAYGSVPQAVQATLVFF